MFKYSNQSVQFVQSNLIVCFHEKGNKSKSFSILFHYVDFEFFEFMIRSYPLMININRSFDFQFIRVIICGFGVRNRVAGIGGLTADVFLIFRLNAWVFVIATLRIMFVGLQALNFQ